MAQRDLNPQTPSMFDTLIWYSDDDFEVLHKPQLRELKVVFEIIKQNKSITAMALAKAFKNATKNEKKPKGIGKALPTMLNIVFRLINMKKITVKGQVVDNEYIGKIGMKCQPLRAWKSTAQRYKFKRVIYFRG